MTAENGAESEFQRWASEQLELPSDSPIETVKGIFLRRLWADRFCPSVSVRQAYEVLRGGEGDAARLPTGDDAWLEVQQRVRADVEQFADEFFRVPPGARQARWEKLARLAAPFPRVRSRLGNLQYGLTVDLKQQGNDALQVDRLARACCALFVLRPTAQAMLRQSLQAEFADDPSKWALTANLLLAQSPEIAALAPYLMEWLASHAERIDQTARAQGRAASAQAATWAPPPTRLTKDPGDSGSIWRIVLIGLIVSSGLSRLGSFHSSPRPAGEFPSPAPLATEFKQPPAKPTIEPVDTSLIPAKIARQEVELRDEKTFKEQREIERRRLDLINEMLRRREEQANLNQQQPRGNSDVRGLDEPDPAKNPP